MTIAWPMAGPLSFLPFNPGLIGWHLRAQTDPRRYFGAAFRVNSLKWQAAISYAGVISLSQGSFAEISANSDDWLRCASQSSDMVLLNGSHIMDTWYS